MKTLIVIALIIAIVTPPTAIRAGVVRDLDPIERELISPQQLKEAEKEMKKQPEQKRLEEDLGREFQKPPEEKIATKKSGSKWWLWTTIGVVVAGGVALALSASKDKGGGEEETGNISTTW